MTWNIRIDSDLSGNDGLIVPASFAAISQRTKDSGVLRILSYARWQILVSFLLESLVISPPGQKSPIALPDRDVDSADCGVQVPAHQFRTVHPAA
jgi:hypothetical protein